MNRLSILVPTLLTAALPALADKPFQLALLPPETQIVPAEESIRGFRLNWYGSNFNVSGCDLGLVNETTGRFSGFGLGIANLVTGSMEGVQISAVGYSSIEGDADGVDISLVGDIGGSLEGFQTGLVAITEKDLDGVQLGGLWNQVDENMTGFQLGLVNRAGKASGLQIGLVNLADDAAGLQIGLFNMIRSKPSLGILPIVNWKF